MILVRRHAENLRGVCHGHFLIEAVDMAYRKRHWILVRGRRTALSLSLFLSPVGLPETKRLKLSFLYLVVNPDEA